MQSHQIIKIALKEAEQIEKDKTTTTSNAADNNNNPLPPLAEHVEYFTSQGMKYCPASTAAGLNELQPGDWKTNLKNVVEGAVISAFNASHSSKNNLPTVDGQFLPSPKSKYARALHLGTTRIFKADGNIDENYLKQFKNHIAENGGTLSLDSTHEYLKIRSETDPQEPDTGRHEDNVISKKVQEFAAVGAWDKLFEVATDNDKPTLTDPEVEKFFRQPATLWNEIAKRNAAKAQQQQVSATSQVEQNSCPRSRLG